MPTKYLHSRCSPNSFPAMKKGENAYPSYETTIKIVYGEEGLSPNEVEVSIGICSPNDMFCRALGRADADSKTPVILAKHKVFGYLDTFAADWGKNRKHHPQLKLPDARRLAIALLRSN